MSESAQNTQNTQNKKSEDQAPQGQFHIQKIYVEDISVESPSSPAVFQENWKPEANIELSTASELLPSTPDTHKVSLTVTVTAKTAQKTAFLIQLKQVGIFTIANFPEAQMGHILGSFCPSTLFPYAREMLSSLVTRAGFPYLQLAPVNFDALYAQGLQQKQQAKTPETIQ